MKKENVLHQEMNLKILAVVSMQLIGQPVQDLKMKLLTSHLMIGSMIWTLAYR